MGAAGSQAAAVAAVGATSAAAGAFYLAQGTGSAIVNSRRKKRLNQIANAEAEQESAANAAIAANNPGGEHADGGGDGDLQAPGHQAEEQQAGNGAALGSNLGRTARIGADTSAMKQKVATATAVKGAAMIAGGVTVIALASNPIGWAVLTGAALIGAAAAIWKFFQKKTRRKDAVDRELGLDVEFAVPDGASKSERKQIQAARETARTERLQALGFANIAQMYQAILDGAAKHLVQVLETGEQHADYETVVQIVSNLGLKVPKAGDQNTKKSKMPTVDQIAKKLKG
jgi:hypothetical protein